MRQWISLFENFTFPSFSDAITDDVVDEIIHTGKWVDHGIDLKNQWLFGIFDQEAYQISPSLPLKSFEDVKDTPEFREVVRRKMQSMAKHHEDILKNGSKYHHIGPFTAESHIYRGLTGPLSDTHTGVYWSQLKDQALERFIDHRIGGIILIAKAKDVTINWYETIRSRFDTSSGMDELEIQLVKGSPVKAIAARVAFSDTGVQKIKLIGTVNRIA